MCSGLLTYTYIFFFTFYSIILLQFTMRQIQKIKVIFDFPPYTICEKEKKFTLKDKYNLTHLLQN